MLRAGSGTPAKYSSTLRAANLRFEEGRRWVHRDGYIAYRHAFYSVPPEFLGRELWVRCESRILRIFTPKMEQVAVHAQARDPIPGLSELN